MIAVRPYVHGEKITEPGVYSGVPMAVYHSGALCDGPSISSSGLRTIFNDSPMEYWVNSPLNPQQIEQKEKEAFILGRGTHHLALGEADFGKYFTIRPEEYNGKAWHSNRTECKEWLADAAMSGLTVLTPGQIEQIRGMVGVLPWQKGLIDSGLANSHLVQVGGILNGLVEHTIAVRDEETGIWLLSRPDSIPLDSTVEADIKTTTAVDYDSLQRTVTDYRYDMQAALARMCLHRAAGIDLTNFALVFVMTKPPHAVQIVEIKSADMDEAEEDLGAAIRTFARCLKTMRWPGPGGAESDGIPIGLNQWARERATRRRDFLNREITA